MFHLVIHDAHMRLCHLPWVKLPPWQAGSGQLDVVAERLQVVAGAVAKRYKVTGGMALRKGPSLAERESQITTIILTCIIDYSFLVLKYLCEIFLNAGNLPCPAGMATTLVSLQLGPQEICHRQAWVNGWHPKSHMMHSKARPRGKVWTQAGQQKANPSAWPAEGKLPTCPLCVRFPETPKLQPFKKKQPNYNANSWGELWVQTTLNSDIQIFNSQKVFSRVTEMSTRRLRWFVISSSWLVSSAPCRPDLPPSLRSPEVGASTWSHASPVVTKRKTQKKHPEIQLFEDNFQKNNLRLNPSIDLSESIQHHIQKESSSL